MTRLEEVRTLIDLALTAKASGVPCARLDLALQFAQERLGDALVASASALDVAPAEPEPASLPTLEPAVAVAERAVYSPVDDDCDKLVKLLRKVGKVTRTAALDRHLGRGWGKTERGSKARIDVAAEQGVLLGRIKVAGTGVKGSPVTYELVA